MFLVMLLNPDDDGSKAVNHGSKNMPMFIDNML